MLSHQPFSQFLPCSPPDAKPIALDFEDLALFAQVQNQYQDLGIRFEGAIAIQPSHPAFVPPSGSIVLIPLTDRSTVTIHFDQAVQKAGAIVIGSRQIRLTAFDRHSNVLAQDRTRTPLQVAADSIEVFPQQKLEVTGDRIARLVFAADAPFVLDDFYCSGDAAANQG